MATSGKIQGKTYNSSGSDVTSRYGTWIEWKRNSYSTTNNTSNITVTVYVQRIDSYQYETAWNLETKPAVSIKVGGVAKTPNTINYIDTRNHKLCTVATWTGDVGHTADGSLTIALSCDWTLSGTPSLAKGSISNNVVLDTIPRASQPSCITWPQTTQNVGYIGSTFTIHMNKKAAFTHYVYCKWGSKTVEIGKNVADNVSWTIPMDFTNDIPNSTTGTGTIYVDTYNGTSKIGTQSVSFTASVPTYNPTISNIALTGNNLLSGAYVQGKSTVTAEITASTMYGATIKSYSATVDGKTYTGNKFTSSALSNGSKTISVTVTDTRGKTATLSSSAFTVYAYAIPNITEFTVVRQADGTTVIATVKGSVAAINNKNAKIVTVTLNGVTQTITSSSYTINGTTTFTNVPTDNTLTATAKIQDSYTYDSKDTVLPTVKVTEDYHHSGNGKALGKVSETEDLLDVAWNALVRKDLTVDGKTTLNKALTVSDTDWKTVILKRLGAIGAVTIQFQNDTGSLGFIGMTGNELNTPLRRWTSDGTTAYTVLDTALTKDFVVEQGTSGIWTYRKWDSGFAECWGIYTMTSACTKAWGALYYSDTLCPRINYPFTFKSRPQETVFCRGDSVSAWAYPEGGGIGMNTTTQTGQYGFLRPTTMTAAQVRYEFTVIGRWK